MNRLTQQMQFIIEIVKEASPILGKLVEEIIADCIAAGYLKKKTISCVNPR